PVHTTGKSLKDVDYDQHGDRSHSKYHLTEAGSHKRRVQDRGFRTEEPIKPGAEAAKDHEGIADVVRTEEYPADADQDEGDDHLDRSVQGRNAIKPDHSSDRCTLIGSDGGEDEVDAVQSAPHHEGPI